MHPAGNDPIEEAALEAAVKERAEAVGTLLADANHAEALRASLSDPPVGSKVGRTKAENAAAVRRVLLATPEGQIEASIEALTVSERDALMKYLYRLLGDEPGVGQGGGVGSNSRLLTWHGRLVAAGGVGSIVRALTDRRTV